MARDSYYQRTWKMTNGAILLVLAQHMARGGLPSRLIQQALSDELGADQKLVQDSLDFLVREELIAKEQREGLLGEAVRYSILPAGVEVITAGRKHPHIPEGPEL